MFELLVPILISLHVEPVRIAVIDTGFNPSKYTFNLCKESLNLTPSTMAQGSDHGQNVTHIIAKHMKYESYCIIPIKLFDSSRTFDMNNFYKALEFVREKNADILNMSLAGGIPDRHEMELISGLLNHGVVVVTSAGNQHKNLDEACDVFPACDDPRIIIVGSVNRFGVVSDFSNYGKKVTTWANGESQTAGGITFSGTSQAAPQITAKIANKMIYLRRKYEQSKY